MRYECYYLFVILTMVFFFPNRPLITTRIPCEESLLDNESGTRSRFQNFLFNLKFSTFTLLHTQTLLPFSQSDDIVPIFRTYSFFLIKSYFYLVSLNFYSFNSYLRVSSYNKNNIGSLSLSIYLLGHSNFFSQCTRIFTCK